MFRWLKFGHSYVVPYEFIIYVLGEKWSISKAACLPFPYLDSIELFRRNCVIELLFYMTFALNYFFLYILVFVWLSSHFIDCCETSGKKKQFSTLEFTIVLYIEVTRINRFSMNCVSVCLCAIVSCRQMNKRRPNRTRAREHLHTRKLTKKKTLPTKPANRQWISCV